MSKPFLYELKKRPGYCMLPAGRVSAIADADLSDFPIIETKKIASLTMAELDLHGAGLERAGHDVDVYRDARAIVEAKAAADRAAIAAHDKWRDAILDTPQAGKHHLAALDLIKCNTPESLSVESAIKALASLDAQPESPRIIEMRHSQNKLRELIPAKFDAAAERNLMARLKARHQYLEPLAIRGDTAAQQEQKKIGYAIHMNEYGGTHIVRAMNIAAVNINTL